MEWFVQVTLFLSLGLIVFPPRTFQSVWLCWQHGKQLAGVIFFLRNRQMTACLGGLVTIVLFLKLFFYELLYCS